MSGALKQIMAHGKLHREDAGRAVIVLDDLPGTSGCSFGEIEVFVLVQAVVPKQEPEIDLSDITDDEWLRAAARNEA